MTRANVRGLPAVDAHVKVTDGRSVSMAIGGCIAITTCGGSASKLLVDFCETTRTITVRTVNVDKGGLGAVAATERITDVTCVGGSVVACHVHDSQRRNSSVIAQQGFARPIRVQHVRRSFAAKQVLRAIDRMRILIPDNFGHVARVRVELAAQSDATGLVDRDCARRTQRHGRRDC